MASGPTRRNQIRPPDVPPWEQPEPSVPEWETEEVPEDGAIHNPLEFMAGEVDEVMSTEQASDPKNDPNRNQPDPFEVPSSQFMPRPLYSWGILGATVASLRDSFKIGKPLLGLSSIAINAIDPVDVVSYPAIIVSLSSMEVKASGFHPVWVKQDPGTYPTTTLYPNDDVIDENQWYYPPYPGGATEDSRDYVDLSSGEIQVTLISYSTGEILKLQDYFTQLYQMSYLYPDTFYLDAQNRKYIDLAYQPGIISWGAFSRRQDEQTTGRTRAIYEVSTTFKFWAEHTLPFELDRVESVDVEAIPLSALL